MKRSDLPHPPPRERGWGSAFCTTLRLVDEVVDEGRLVRAVLRLGAVSPRTGSGAALPRSACGEPVTRVRVVLRPGSNATFFEARHPFESRPRGRLLRIAVGSLRAEEFGEVDISVVIGAGIGRGDVLDVARATISARVPDGKGGFDRHTIRMPIRYSERSGATVEPRVIIRPIGEAA